MKINKITLGTAQLTTDYGIVNSVLARKNKESPGTVLSVAFDMGIRSVDTAPGYGSSEEVVGDFLQQHPMSDVIVCTKLPSASRSQNAVHYTEIESFIDAHVASSGKKLGRPIDYFLLHDIGDLEKYGARLVKRLEMHREMGVLKIIGFSLYAPIEMEWIRRFPSFEALQFPANLFDHRFLEERVQSFIQEKAIHAFARSVFLQGLFTLDPEMQHPQVDCARRELRLLRGFARELGWSIEALALAFVNSFSHIRSIVLGMENRRQIIENVANNEKVLPAEIREDILSKFAGIADTITDPRLWSVQ